MFTMDESRANRAATGHVAVQMEQFRLSTEPRKSIGKSSDRTSS
jgi:hypothetical protein